MSAAEDRQPGVATSEAGRSADAGPGLDDPAVVRALQEYRAAAAAGQRPDRRELLARFPEVAGELSACLDALDFIEGAAVQLPPAAPAEEPPHPGTLGDFLILREVGRGGMGIVYEAEQVSLGRRVALKVLPFAATMNARQLQRFHNEARAAACLHHTNIVPVYAVGSERGLHYYAMQFIEGQTLADLVQQLRQPAGVAEFAGSASGSKAGQITAPRAALLTEGSPADGVYFRAAARLGMQAAEALEHAHQVGVLHRDVKPANLLLDTGGNLWVTDFGLAQVRGDTRLTLTGDLVGTLRYMSPEQARAKHGLADHRTDVYSLGATLYELLALEPAFNDEDRQELLRQITFEEPRRPRTINKAIPVDLETVVLKAMAKDPEERYATARELVEDLRRFLEHKPVRARRPSLWQRTRKWVRRHWKLLTAIILSALLAQSVTVAVLLAKNAEVRAEQERTASKKREAENARDAEGRARAKADEHFARAVALVHRMEEASRDLSVYPHTAAFAQQLCQESLALYQGLLKERPGDPKLKLNVARSLWRLGTIVSSRGQNPSAEDFLTQARGKLEELSQAPVVPAEVHSILGNVHQELAQIELAREKYPAGLDHLATAIDCQRKAVATEGNDRTFRHRLGRHYLLQGYLLRQAKREGSKESYEEAGRLFQDLIGNNSDRTPHYRHDLGRVRLAVARILRAEKDPAEAENLVREAEKQFKQALGERPSMLAWKADLAGAQDELGQLLVGKNEIAEAERVFVHACTTTRELALAFPAKPTYQCQHGIVASNLATLLAMRRQTVRARGLLAEAVRHLERACKLSPDDTHYRDFLTRVGFNLGVLAAKLRDHSAAAQTLTLVCKYLASGDDHFTAACGFSVCAALAEKDTKLTREQQRTLKEKYLNQSLQSLDRALEAGFHDCKRIETDGQLAPLRETDQFKKWLESHSSGDKPGDSAPRK